MKLLHWNINQRYCNQSTPEFIFEEIYQFNPDIIVLTEFDKTKNYNFLVAKMEKANYRVIVDSRPAKDKISQVLIAINNNIIKNETVSIMELPNNEENIIVGDYPNFLRVDFNYNEIPLTIIGTRIRILKSSGTSEQLRRKKQLEKLMEVIPSDRSLIILGDFNISNHPAFKRQLSKWHFNDIYERLLLKKSLQLLIPDGDVNSPFSSDFKLDHLIISEDICIEQKPKYFSEEFWNTSKRNYPDHSILFAEVYMRNKNNLKN